MKRRDRRKDNTNTADTGVKNGKNKLKIAPDYLNKRDGPAKRLTVTAQIYVGGLHSDTQETDVREHFNDLDINDCQLLHLSNGNQNLAWKSCKITVPCAKRDQALNTDNLPEGVRARMFYPERQQRPFRGNDQQQSAYGRRADDNRQVTRLRGAGDRQQGNNRQRYNQRSRVAWGSYDYRPRDHNERRHNIRREELDERPSLPTYDRDNSYTQWDEYRPHDYNERRYTRREDHE